MCVRKGQEGLRMIAFEKTGTVNTEETLKIALAAAAERKLDIVVASSEGNTAKRLVALAKEQKLEQHIVVVRCAYGSKEPGTNRMSEEIVRELEQQGAAVVTAAHALSGAERGITKAFGSVHPGELMAYTLRMFGQGMKVCVEIALMALDCGSISYGRPVVCIGGSGRGADTACILTPSYSSSLLETKIHEILCKPALYPEENPAK